MNLCCVNQIFWSHVIHGIEKAEGTSNDEHPEDGEAVFHLFVNLFII